VHEHAWPLLADEEISILITSGNIPATTALAHEALRQVAARAAADPTNTGWPRDLSISHDRLAERAFKAGDLATAREHASTRRSTCGSPRTSPRRIPGTRNGIGMSSSAASV
jgi:vacuolar-type H+-ATPase catalytic subunit A/Vma1